IRNYQIQCWESNCLARCKNGRIQRRFNFPGVIGAVDGTHTRITVPRNDSQSYINHKGVHSIQLQIVCNDKLEIMHGYAGLPGYGYCTPEY
ncbi:hypothetical protein TSAR_016837, partial [Trichomalopsis sarcophagae]